MDIQNEKVSMKGKASLLFLAFIMHGFCSFAAELKLSDASLDKVIELYSAATHMNILLMNEFRRREKLQCIYRACL